MNTKDVFVTAGIFFITGSLSALDLYANWRYGGWLAPILFSIGLLVIFSASDIKINFWRFLGVFWFSSLAYILAIIVSVNLPFGGAQTIASETKNTFMIMAIPGVIGSLIIRLALKPLAPLQPFIFAFVGALSALAGLAEPQTLMFFMLMFIPWHVCTGITIALSLNREKKS